MPKVTLAKHDDVIKCLPPDRANQAFGIGVLAVHLAIILFSVFGLVAVPIGAICNWRFVHIRWWRVLGVLSLAAVPAQAMLRSSKLALSLWLAILLGIGVPPARAAGIASMQILAVTKNQFLDIVWPWPATAVRIITVEPNATGKAADVRVEGETAGTQFTLTSCLIKPPAIACMPSASTTPCCVLSSPTLPTEIDLLADATVPAGNYMVYLAAPGSSLKGLSRARPASVRKQPTARTPSSPRSPPSR